MDSYTAAFERLFEHKQSRNQITRAAQAKTLILDGLTQNEDAVKLLGYAADAVAELSNDPAWGMAVIAEIKSYTEPQIRDCFAVMRRMYEKYKGIDLSDREHWGQISQLVAATGKMDMLTQKLMTAVVQTLRAEAEQIEIMKAGGKTA